MRILILGSGTILSDFRRQCASYLLRHQGHEALLDVGNGAVLQLKKSGSDPLKIEALFLSHFHLDHTADLFPLLLWRALLEPQANKRLKIFGPPNTVRWFTALAAWQGRWLTQAPPRLIEVQKGASRSWAGLPLTVHPTPHTTESVAWRFGDVLFYSGDTDWSDALVDFAVGCRCGLLECSFPDHLKKRGHLTISESARLARKAQFECLMLTHFYPQNEQENIRAQVERIYTGRTIIASDLTVLEI